MFTYIAPLAIVVTITMAKEAVDDFNRCVYRRLCALRKGLSFICIVHCLTIIFVFVRFAYTAYWWEKPSPDGDVIESRIKRNLTNCNLTAAFDRLNLQLWRCCTENEFYWLLLVLVMMVLPYYYKVIIVTFCPFVVTLSCPSSVNLQSSLLCNRLVMLFASKRIDAFPLI